MTPLRLWELAGQPDLATIQAMHPERYPGLFRTTGTDSGWDILFGFPQQIDRFSISDGLAALVRHPAMQLRTPARNEAATQLPFTGGWLAFMAYELGGLLEPSVGYAPALTDFPLAWLARIPVAILRQPSSGRCVLMIEEAYAGLTEAALRDVENARQTDVHLPGLDSLTEETPEQFLRGVSAIQNYIRAGDVFQVNLSRVWRVRFSAAVDPSALFLSLMTVNPAPFSALLHLGEYAVVSSSPERLVSVARNGKISTRPIAGTHPRGATRAEDDHLRTRLAANPKERAEHVMLVDLERNDLGRVCVPGSVRVEALMDITRYQYVHHIESTIAGYLKDDVRVFDILRAVFPGGTITGCPKVRTMQIIRELEGSSREAYTGSVGYINHDGSMDFNILIRSFQVAGAQVTFRAGAGIVADSEAQRELAETRAKAHGLLRTLGVH
jgi:anthranilate synthase component 1